jgi:hypothetical protein
MKIPQKTTECIGSILAQARVATLVLESLANRYKHDHLLLFLVLSKTLAILQTRWCKSV